MRTIYLTDKQYELVVSLVETRSILLADLTRGQKVVLALDEIDDLLKALDGAKES